VLEVLEPKLRKDGEEVEDLENIVGEEQASGRELPDGG